MEKAIEQFKEFEKKENQEGAKGKSWDKLLLIVAVISFVYIFIPEPSDVIPVIGWLDEVAAGGVSMSALVDLIVRYLWRTN